MRQVTRRRPASRPGAGHSEADSKDLSSRRRGREPVLDEDGEDHPGGTEEFAQRSSRRRNGNSGKPPVTSGGRGWASHHRNQARGKRGFGAHPDEFKVAQEDTTYLVKALEDEPFWSYCEHFINEITDGKRSFTCAGDDCPLCAYGDTPRAYDLFNVAVWEPEADGGQGAWVQKFWRATPDPAGKVLARAEELGSGRNPRALGDYDVYLAVSKSKSGKRKGGSSFNEFSIDLVKERDLEEDYDADPLADEELDEMAGKLFDDSVCEAASLKDLRAAAEVLDE